MSLTATCANPGCGGMAAKGKIYCGDCARSARPYGDDITDVDTVLLGERLGQKLNWGYRIARHGLHDCALCGREALPGRQYCSNGCRDDARKKKPARYVVDGISASIIKHAKRLGIPQSTVYKRMARGMTAEEALTTPVDEVMSRRSRSQLTDEIEEVGEAE